MLKLKETKTRKIVNSLLTCMGLLLLTVVFGASSETFGQSRDRQQNDKPQNEKPQSEKPQSDRKQNENSTPREGGIKIECKPEPITDDNGNIEGGAIKCTIKDN
jgi:hypothetical protein